MMARENASFSNFASRRRALTLIEIMASIMVLAIGLVGVLAAIPFGGFRLSQMNEADYSVTLGRNAARVLRSNQWTNPKYWCLRTQTNNGNAQTSVNQNSVLDMEHLNLTYPYFIDPLAKNSGTYRYLPEFYQMTPSSGISSFFTRVCPLFNDSKTLYNVVNVDVDMDNRYERAFYLQDDLLSGIATSEEEGVYRPQVETEGDQVADNGGSIPSFTGRYTWFASVYPKCNSSSTNNCSIDDVVSVDYDVVVCRDRILGDERAFTATVDASTYQGGSVTIDLTTQCGFQDSNNANHSSVSMDSLAESQKIIEQLENTRYIMLMGQGDVSFNGGNDCFARWYKISSYAITGYDDNGVPNALRVMLVGPNVPNVWASGSQKISAVIFPGAVGVYSGSVVL